MVLPMKVDKEMSGCSSAAILVDDHPELYSCGKLPEM